MPVGYSAQMRLQVWDNARSLNEIGMCSVGISCQ